MSPSVAEVHFCLGAAPTRMEARTVFSTMLHRMPDWDTERIEGTVGGAGPFRGYASLPTT